MAQQTLKKLQYNGSDVVVEVAKRDINGAQIDTTYLKKAQLVEGTGIEVSDSNGNKVVAVKQATDSVLGGIKLGTGLTYNSTSGKVDVSSAAWSGVTSKPFSEVDSGSGKTFTITSNKLYVNTDVIATRAYVGDNFLSINTTLPATNVIPTQSTANKVLLSTTTGGTAAWSSGALSSSATKPLYLNSSGVLTAGNTYAGGTAVTLNEVSKAGNTASFFAPTETGTTNTIVVSTGTHGIPTFSNGNTWNGSAGFLKVDAYGVTSVDGSTYLTSHQSLSNYYTKSETYTKTEVNGLISGVHEFTYELSSSLPTASASTMYKIYFVPASDTSNLNAKEEYITIRSGSEGSYTYSWEHIGSTNIDTNNFIKVIKLGTNNGTEPTVSYGSGITSANILSATVESLYDLIGEGRMVFAIAYKADTYQTLGGSDTAYTEQSFLVKANGRGSYVDDGETITNPNKMLTFYNLEGFVWRIYIDDENDLITVQEALDYIIYGTTWYAQGVSGEKQTTPFASSTTNNNIMLGGGPMEIKASSYQIDSSESVVANLSTKIPNSKAVYTELRLKQNALTFSTGLTNSSNTVTLNTATADALGGIKIGTGLSITDGVVSVASAPTAAAWSGNPFTVTDVTLDY